MSRMDRAVVAGLCLFASAACVAEPVEPQEARPVEASFRRDGPAALQPLKCSFDIALTEKSVADNTAILRALFDSHPEWGTIRQTGDSTIGELVTTHWELSLALKDCHHLEKIASALVSVQDRAGQRMLAHTKGECSLRFVSTDAMASSQAVISFEVQPSEAQIFIVTEVPGTSPMAAHQGAVTIPVTFNFIREHRFIYFFSEHEGLRRYYRFAIAEERKEELEEQSREQP
jgi:hypothetical protein